MPTVLENDEIIGEGLVQKAPANTHEPGEHVAEVVSVKNVGPNKYNPEKDQFAFTFNLSDGGSTTMWVNKSFGFSKLNGFSKLAQLIAALTGTPEGDPRQRQYKLSEFVGRKMNVITELSEKGYPNIKAFAPHEEVDF
jgi:hypothetical protein